MPRRCACRSRLERTPPGRRRSWPVDSLRVFSRTEWFTADIRIIGATFGDDGHARRARDRIVGEVTLPSEPQFVRAAAPGEGVTLLGVRVPDDVGDRVREI